MNNRIACVIAATLLLAACGDEPIATGDDGREATGEVLEGSISDAMLPLDEVQSQAPLADPDPEEAGESNPAPMGADDPAVIEPNEDAGIMAEPSAEGAE